MRSDAPDESVNPGPMDHGAAFEALAHAAIALGAETRARDSGDDALRQRIGQELFDGAARDGLARTSGASGGTVAVLRPDLAPALAERLGITDPGQPLTPTGIAHLLSARRLDGGEIAGRKKGQVQRIRRGDVVVPNEPKTDFTSLHHRVSSYVRVGSTSAPQFARDTRHGGLSVQRSP
jgi:hypothetical protein